MGTFTLGFVVGVSVGMIACLWADHLAYTKREHKARARREEAYRTTGRTKCSS